MFEYATVTVEPLNFLEITPTYNVPIDKKFSRNWLEFLDPRDFDNNLKQIDESSDEEESDDEPIIPTRKKKTTKKSY